MPEAIVEFNDSKRWANTEELLGTLCPGKGVSVFRRH